jgi:hypothetical protein
LAVKLASEHMEKTTADQDYGSCFQRGLVYFERQIEVQVGVGDFGETVR